MDKGTSNKGLNPHSSDMLYEQKYQATYSVHLLELLGHGNPCCQALQLLSQQRVGDFYTLCTTAFGDPAM